MGQTKRILNTRVGEHRNHIRRNSTQSLSLTTVYCLIMSSTGTVLDEEMKYKKRLISEMIHIKKNNRMD